MTMSQFEVRQAVCMRTTFAAHHVVTRLWHAVLGPTRSLMSHPDPLVEASNCVALVIGTHLPFWPLYIWWAAGAQALPSALLTAAFAPIFMGIPLLSRRSGVLGRSATILAGVGNTVFTIWVLGGNTGTELFFAPCAALAAISFRRHERWLMVVTTSLPLIAWLGLRSHALPSLHHYDAQVAQDLFVLNAVSVSVLATVFGWVQADAYDRLHKTPPRGLART